MNGLVRFAATLGKSHTTSSSDELVHSDYAMEMVDLNVVTSSSPTHPTRYKGIEEEESR